MILEESHDISPFKLLNSPPTMLVVQYIIDLEQHVELHDPFPLTRDEKDKVKHNLLCCA